MLKLLLALIIVQACHVIHSYGVLIANPKF